MRLTLKVLAWLVIPIVAVGETMPVEQQNALVKKYCAPCHNDAHLTGGLTLEHFDAAHVEPSLAAMLMSKLTNGLPLERVHAANIDQAAASAIDTEMKSSAIHAAGLPAPDSAISHAWVMALSAEAAHATEWTVTQAEGASPGHVTASILLEVTAANDPAKADLYRLIVTCQADNGQAEMKLAWAPGGPKAGTIVSAVVDGKASLTYEVEPSEKVFKGSRGGDAGGPGAAIIYAAENNSGAPPMPLPEQTLTVSHLLPDGPLVFQFGDLPQTARQELSNCFSGSSLKQGSGQ